MTTTLEQTGLKDAGSLTLVSPREIPIAGMAPLHGVFDHALASGTDGVRPDPELPGLHLDAGKYLLIVRGTVRAVTAIPMSLLLAPGGDTRYKAAPVVYLFMEPAEADRRFEALHRSMAALLGASPPSPARRSVTEQFCDVSVFTTAAPVPLVLMGGFRGGDSLAVTTTLAVHQLQISAIRLAD
jgi:hypothetical protein